MIVLLLATALCAGSPPDRERAVSVEFDQSGVHYRIRVHGCDDCAFELYDITGLSSAVPPRGVHAYVEGAEGVLDHCGGGKGFSSYHLQSDIDTRSDYVELPTGHDHTTPWYDTATLFRGLHWCDPSGGAEAWRRLKVTARVKFRSGEPVVGQSPWVEISDALRERLPKRLSPDLLRKIGVYPIGDEAE